MLHLIHGNESNMFNILTMFEEHIVKSGDQKLEITGPSLIYNYLRLADKLEKNQDNTQAKLQEIYKRVKMILAMIQETKVKIFIKISLDFAMCINKNCNDNESYDEYVYDILSEALMTYQTEISEQHEKNFYLKQFIGCLMQLKCLSEDNYQTLANNIT